MDRWEDKIGVKGWEGFQVDGQMDGYQEGGMQINVFHF